MPNSSSVPALVWAGFIALALAMGIGRFAFTPLLPMMQKDLGLGLAQGGWLASANYLGYFAGALTAAFLPWSASTLLRAGLLLVAASTALMGWTSVWSTWITWRSVAGVASAWVLVATASLCLARLTAAGTPHKGGWVFAGVGGGIALTGLLCMAADLRGISSANTWLTLGGLTAVGLLATCPLWKIQTSAPSSSTALARNNDHNHLRLILCYGLFGFGYILPATFLPAQARVLLDDEAIFGLAWPVFGLAAAFSTLACGVLLKRIQLRRLWLLSQLLMAVGVVIPAVVPGLGSIITAALCVGGTFMVVTMLGMQQAHNSGGPRARVLIANLTAAFAMGQLAGPVLFSLANKHLGVTLDSSLYLACAALLLSCLLLLKPFPEYAATQLPEH
ncbi:MAG: YbfB/YjiJ family MFS transporter [Alcaligenaceae bacterium]|nr:YbfB/YjiJ family MFS transporter [Alcaligenaceae bacterium]